MGQARLGSVHLFLQVNGHLMKQDQSHESKMVYVAIECMLLICPNRYLDLSCICRNLNGKGKRLTSSSWNGLKKPTTTPEKEFYRKQSGPHQHWPILLCSSADLLFETFILFFCFSFKLKKNLESPWTVVTKCDCEIFLSKIREFCPKQFVGKTEWTRGIWSRKRA